MTPSRLLVVVSLAVSAPVLAEAGLPSTSFCREATCACGQVCNVFNDTCGSAQMGYCTSDSACEASCGSFICEGNVCVPGERADGGNGTGGGGGAGGGTADQRGCSVTPASVSVGLLGLVAALRFVRLRRERR